jgi:hypothetical protein
MQAWFMHDGLGVICCDSAQIIVEIGARWAEHLTRGFHRGIMPPTGKQKVMSRTSRWRPTSVPGSHAPCW